MHLVCTSLLSFAVAVGGRGGDCGNGRLNLQPNFQKMGGGLDNTSTFRGGFWGKRGMAFFREGCNFYIKNKLKYELFNEK